MSQVASQQPYSSCTSQTSSQYTLNGIESQPFVVAMDAIEQCQNSQLASQASSHSLFAPNFELLNYYSKELGYNQEITDANLQEFYDFICDVFHEEVEIVKQIRRDREAEMQSQSSNSQFYESTQASGVTYYSQVPASQASN